MGVYKLDIKNRKILSELDKDSRQSYSEVGKKVGLSKEVVNYRVKSLEKADIIKGYYALIDVSKLGYIHIRHYLKFMDLDYEEEQKVLDFLIGSQDYTFISKIDGTFDYGLFYTVRSITDAAQHHLLFKKKFNKYIKYEQISFFTCLTFLGMKFLIDTKERFQKVIASNSGIVKYDQIDLEIIKQLSFDCRQSLISIAKKTGISFNIIMKRLKRLHDEKIIVGYTLKLNNESLGYYLYKIDLKLRDLSEYKKLYYFIMNHSLTVYIDDVYSGWDLEFDIMVPNKNDCISVIEEIKKKFSSVREYRYYSYKFLVQRFVP